MNPLRIAFNWVQYRRTLAELNNLSNDTLNDIGVNRYLGKPYQEHELLRNVFELLAQVRADEGGSHG